MSATKASSVKSLMSQQHWVPVYEPLFQVMDVISAVVLAKLINHYTFWENTGKLQRDGSFYKTKVELAKELSISDWNVEKAQKDLEALGVIGTQKIRLAGGLAVSTLWHIDFNRLEELITEATKKFNDLRYPTELGTVPNPVASTKNPESPPFKKNSAEEIGTPNVPTTSSPVVETSPTATHLPSPEVPISTPPTPVRDAQTKPIEVPPSNPVASTHGNIRATPSIDEIRLDWESRNNIATESPSFSNRLPLLQELMATYKSHGYSIDEINSRSNRTKILEHYYKRIKKKSSKDAAERSSLEDWEAALGLLVEGTVRVAQAPKKPSNHHIVAFEDKRVDPENQLTDEEIDRMLDER